MTLNPVMEQFYLSLLDYSGLKVQDNIIVQKNEKLGDFTIDDKFISLPYMEMLKNPQGKTFFHLLNENYTSPETTLFTMFKNRLVLELNLRFTSLITSLIAVASDVMMQQRIQSSALIDVVTTIGETDHSVIEAFLGMVKASTKQNKEAYIVDIFLKKNGEIQTTPYAAIGKLNFRLYEEVKRALESPEKDYRVYGFKVRKKDLMTVYNVMVAVFKDIDNKEAYVEGTDNKVFRYLNILLKTSYLCSARINDIADMLDALKEPSLNVEEIRGNHDWVESLNKLQGMATEIRLIPNQVDISTEAKRLVIDESKATAPATQTTFNPAMVQQTQLPVSGQQPIQQQHQQPMVHTQQLQYPNMVQQPQQELTPEEIIRNRTNNVMSGMPPQMPIQMPMMQANMYPGMPQPNMAPTWMQAEMMKAQGQLNPAAQNPAMMNPLLLQQMQQQLLQQQQQQQMQQQLQMQQMQANMGIQMPIQMPMVQPNMTNNQGIQLNPLFMQRTGLNV